MPEFGLLTYSVLPSTPSRILVCGVNCVDAGVKLEMLSFAFTCQLKVAWTKTCHWVLKLWLSNRGLEGKRFCILSAQVPSCSFAW